MKKKDEIKVCLVGSSGGHLTHLYMLKPFWKDKNRFWVTFDKEDPEIYGSAVIFHKIRFGEKEDSGRRVWRCNERRTGKRGA